MTFKARLTLNGKTEGLLQNLLEKGNINELLGREFATPT